MSAAPRRTMKPVMKTTRPLPPMVEEDGIMYEDGEPMETHWHVLELMLLQDLVCQRMGDRQDFYVGGNNFIHYRPEDAANPKFKGPDFFFVKDVPRQPLRPAWIVWRENGRFPNVIIELLSKTTAKEDRTTKKDLYEQVFHTPEYYLCDSITKRLTGWRLNQQGKYDAILPNDKEWLWSEEFGLWLGTWKGEVNGLPEIWLRFYDEQGNLVPTGAEAERQRAEEAGRQVEAERQRAEQLNRRAEAERQRAEEIKQQAEAEIARLKALLEQSQPAPSSPKRKKRPS